MDYFVTTSTKPIQHKEGDVWEENGKTWTIKNGIKRTVGKLDAFRKEIIMPIACPCCNKSMKSPVHQPFWKIYKLCLNCVVDMEHNIRKAGKWDAYERAKIEANAKSLFEDLEQYVSDFTTTTSGNGFVTEDGAKEHWIDNTKDKAKEVGKQELEQLQKVITNYTDTHI